jgi:hypothetical protein
MPLLGNFGLCQLVIIDEFVVKRKINLGRNLALIGRLENGKLGSEATFGKFE